MLAKFVWDSQLLGVPRLRLPSIKRLHIVSHNQTSYVVHAPESRKGLRVRQMDEKDRGASCEGYIGNDRNPAAEWYLHLTMPQLHIYHVGFSCRDPCDRQWYWLMRLFATSHYDESLYPDTPRVRYC